MKIKKRLFTALICGVAAVFVFGVASSAVGDYGTSSNPLVTLDYITGVFTPEMNKSITSIIETKTAALKSELDSKIAELEKKYSEASAVSGVSTYSVISLESGKTLTGSKGCEIMLRVGSAHCVASASPGLIDTTTATVLENGASLTKNHMYMVTIDGRGIKADNSVMIIVRGDYTIS